MESSEKRLLKIGEVARLMGFPVKTFRFYEERGLVEPATRAETALLRRLLLLERGLPCWGWP